MKIIMTVTKPSKYPLHIKEAITVTHRPLKALSYHEALHDNCLLYGLSIQITKTLA